MKKLVIIFCLFLTLFQGYLTGQNLEGIKIYINPGHGGFDSDDRNVPVPPYALGDTAGFWESKSNLVKGLHLRSLLENDGAEVIMSRVLNRSVDDRPLSAIAEEANANQVDFMISIHSNAFNSMTNYVLMLFHGWDNAPILPQSMELANLFYDNLISNQTSFWTYTGRNVRGDKSFAPESWNGYGVLRPLKVPGLISEGSFHDYIPETYRLLNREYKHLEAWNFYKAFLQYYAGAVDPKGKIAGYVKDSFRKVTDYPFVQNSKDQWLPVNGARVTLQPGDLIYQVDSLNNGFYLFDNLEPGIYRLLFAAEKYLPIEVDGITVKQGEVTYYLCQLEQDRSDPMKVLDYSPIASAGERVSAASPVIFRFNFEVDGPSFEKAFSIMPAVAGLFAYADQDRTAMFIPDEPLEPATFYTVNLSKEVMHIGGLSMEEDFSFSFETALKNRLSVVRMYPRDGMDEVYPVTQVRIYFDGRLKNEMLASRIRVEDMAGNILNRTGVELNTFPGNYGSYAFTPSGLTPGQSYRLTLSKDLVDEEGLFLYKDSVINFTVKPVFSSSADVVFDFEESATNWAIDTLGSKNILPGTANRILRYGTSKLFGGYSYRLIYGFGDAEAHVTARPPGPIFTVRNGQYCGLYIWGDLSENKLVLLFDLGGTEVEIPVAEIDFAGWQFRECRLLFPETEADYAFSGFRLKSGGTPFSSGGVIFMDNLLLGDNSSTGIQQAALPDKKILIYPNPNRGTLNVVVPFPDGHYTYRITDLSGRTIVQDAAYFPVNGTNLSTGIQKDGLYMLTVQSHSEIVHGLFSVIFK